MNFYSSVFATVNRLIQIRSECVAELASRRWRILELIVTLVAGMISLQSLPRSTWNHKCHVRGKSL